MPRKKALTSAEYTQGIIDLKASDIVHYGSRIISMAVAHDTLEEKAGRELDRNIIIQKCRSGKLRPMGKYKNTLYFWRKEIEQSNVQQRPPSQKEVSA